MLQMRALTFAELVHIAWPGHGLLKIGTKSDLIPWASSRARAASCLFSCKARLRPLPRLPLQFPPGFGKKRTTKEHVRI